MEIMPQSADGERDACCFPYRVVGLWALDGEAHGSGVLIHGTGHAT